MGVWKDGEGNAGRTKIDEDDVRDIRSLADDGEYTFSEIGEMYNMSRSAIGHIVNRRRWKYVD